MAANMNFLDDSPESLPAKRRFTQSAWFPWFVVLVILIVLLVIFSPVVFIRSGHRGVATFFGDTEGELLTEGAHFKYPLLRVHQFDVRTQTHDVSTGAVTQDMQLVTVGVTVSYRLDTAELKQLFEDVGTDIETKVIDPATKEAISVSATQFTAEELVSKRAEFKDMVVSEVTTRLAESGVIVENVAVINLDFSKTLEEAFAAKTVAEQEHAAAELRQEAADLEADNIQALSDALRGNEAYIQYEILKKWDGKSPLYLAPTSPVQIVNDSQE